MASVNKVILIGHLGRDPELRYTESGNAVANLSLATTETWKDKNGEKQERTEWHRITLWGRVAEVAGEHLRKGAQCYFEGKLQTRKYTDKEGVERYVTEINAYEMRFLGKGNGERRNEPPPPDSHEGRPPPRRQSTDFDDDIPF